MKRRATYQPITRTTVTAERVAVGVAGLASGGFLAIIVGLILNITF